MGAPDLPSDRVIFCKLQSTGISPLSVVDCYGVMPYGMRYTESGTRGYRDNFGKKQNL
jgi:hypothetical protein